jgi:SsrA-binding protein
MSVLLVNRKARFEYEIIESFQAGLSLNGQMVKQIRAKKVQLDGVFIIYQKQAKQLQMLNFGNEQWRENVALLVSKKELKTIQTALLEKRITCIPLQIKQIGRWLKADIALVKGKKQFDKKESIKKRDLDREIRRDESSRYS